METETTASRRGASMRVPARLPLAEARTAPPEAGRRSALLLEHGTLEVRYYAPRGVDPQEPHTRDELYVVASGQGWFVRGDERVPFEPGDALFVAAGVEHRFVDFSEDFGTWVMFYGPEGGERAVSGEQVVSGHDER